MLASHRAGSSNTCCYGRALVSESCQNCPNCALVISEIGADLLTAGPRTRFNLCLDVGRYLTGNLDEQLSLVISRNSRDETRAGRADGCDQGVVGRRLIVGREPTLEDRAESLGFGRRTLDRGGVARCLLGQRVCCAGPDRAARQAPFSLHDHLILEYCSGAARRTQQVNMNYGVP